MIKLRADCLALLTLGATTMAQPLDVRSFGALGNGSTDDREAIQKAIAAAGGTGRSLVFPAGVYRMNQSVQVIGASDMKIVGEGNAVITTENQEINLFVVRKSRNITLSGIAWAAGPKPMKDEGETEEERFTGNCIFVDDSKDVLIERCEFRRGYIGIGAKLSSGVRIEACSFVGISNFGIFTWSSSRTRIADNSFDGGINAVWVAFAKDSVPSDYSITLNAIRNMSYEGINFFGSNSTITDNRIDSCKWGIVVSTMYGRRGIAENNIIRANLITNTGREGIRLAHSFPDAKTGRGATSNICAENIIINSGTSAISVEDSARQNTVDANIVSHTGLGNLDSGDETPDAIYVRSTADCIVTRNRVSLSGRHGIYVLDSRSCSITGNHISDSRGSEIQLVRSSDCMISQNRLMNSHPVPAKAVRPALMSILDRSMNNSVEGNVFGPASGLYLVIDSYSTTALKNRLVKNVMLNPPVGSIIIKDPSTVNDN